jgi:predicted O-methyltransferase YrrM
MQKTNIKNVFIQALKPNSFFVMLKKIRERFMDEKGHHSKNENLNWIKSHSSDFKELAISLDPALWEEADKASKILGENAEKILKNIEYNLGGGGIYPFLYFVTRYVKPDCIVETGVAVGFSSYSFLAAIKINGRGRLYSSDFPYFRLPNPEAYIGIVVEDSLKDNWVLYIDGDEANLPRILNNVKKIDIFHYDSDKSYLGRKMAMSMIESALSEAAIILMDDIQDNSFFYDYVEKKKAKSWYVFEFMGKYVGMVGQLTKRSGDSATPPKFTAG